MPLLTRLLDYSKVRSYEGLPDTIDELTREQLLQCYEEAYPRPPVGLKATSLSPALKASAAFAPEFELAHAIVEANSVDEVRGLVNRARQQRLRVRVAGSKHSVEESIFSGVAGDLQVMLRGELQQMRVESVQGDTALVFAGGGCYLGINPSDPQSTPETSLNRFLDNQGFALPVLGGISHQTIAGFMQTGSAGGSLAHGIADAIEAIQLVDGLGQVRELSGDQLGAAGVSMGLLGIVTGVHLRVKRRYFVQGIEVNVTEESSLVQPDAHGEFPLADALAHTEYLHLNWFPQKFVKRVTQWTGSQVAAAGPIDPYDGELNSKLKNVLAAVVLEITSVFALDPKSDAAQRIIGAFLRKFVSLDRHEAFRDVWLKALPIDDQTEVDTVLKVIFTEIWLPLDQLKPALNRLRDLFARDGAAAGNFIVELYGAKQSKFWLSPAFGRDVVRVDVFWWAFSFGNPREHFTIFWNALLELPGARLHWGKFLPLPGQQCGGVRFNRQFLLQAYDKLPEWLQLRDQFDPDRVFLSPYWAGIFGL